MRLPIDIIIPTYNRTGSIQAVAGSLVPQLSHGDRLYIVWQGEKPSLPPTDSLQVLRSFPPNLPRARNTGISAGNNPVILMLDDDVEVDGHLLDGHRNAYGDSTTGCAAGYIEDPVYVGDFSMPSWFDEQTGQLIQNFSFPESRFTISAPGGNISFRRSILANTGYFDENFLGNALWEEIDFSFRVLAAGYKIWFTTSARLRHLRLPSGGCRHSDSYAYCYRQFANTAYFAARYAPPRYYSTWLRFWKYRLEYIARRKVLWLRHNPIMVLAAVAGACEGITRYLLFGRKYSLPVPREQFFNTVVAAYRYKGTPGRNPGVNHRK
jgi:GT2 family glycosyltransferase